GVAGTEFVRVTVAVAVVLGVPVLVGLGVGVGVIDGVVVGGIQHTCTNTLVVRISSSSATVCRTPACSLLMSSHVHASAVAGSFERPFTPSVYVMVPVTAVPGARTPATLSNGVAELTPERFTERLTVCTKTAVIASGRDATWSSAYRSLSGGWLDVCRRKT